MEDDREDEPDIVELAGETVAAATGPAEVGAAEGQANAEKQPPVGADTRVKVEGEGE